MRVCHVTVPSDRSRLRYGAFCCWEIKKVPKFSLRRFDTQARVGLALAIMAACGLAVLVFGVFQHRDGWTPYYGPTRRLAVLGLGMVTLLLAAGGFGLGFNSAGQRRNDKPRLSWLGFFLGATVMCLTLILLCYFILRGQQIIR